MDDGDLVAVFEGAQGGGERLGGFQIHRCVLLFAEKEDTEAMAVAMTLNSYGQN